MAATNGSHNTTSSTGHGGSSSEHQSVLAVIRNIQGGGLDPNSLGVEDHRRCVEHLTAEGYSTVEIAEILKVSERTIARDRTAIRQANAIQRDPALVKEMVGQLAQQAETTISRIRRATRERGTPPAVRIEGEKACWTIARDLVQQFQALGYLPSAPQEIRGELIHRLDQVPGCDQIQAEVERLELIVDQDESNPQRKATLDRLGEVKSVLTRLALSDRIKQLTTDVTDGIEENDGQAAS
ncbi:MAG: hypothetical protein IH830_05895 [Planctomycetes bacterium]|nr:hypothetical protein [Planctomycetota bacterium]